MGSKIHPRVDHTLSEQSQRFIEAARELGTDEHTEHFKETVRQLAKAPVVRNADRRSKAKRSKPGT